MKSAVIHHLQNISRVSIGMLVGLFVLVTAHHGFAQTQSPPKAMAFQQALPGYTYQFPKDHASHPAFKTEWWYYTGHLRADDDANRTFGYELTFFRSGTGLPKREGSPWQADTFHLVHFAITDDTNQDFYHTAKLNRSGPGGRNGQRAGARTNTYHVWNEDWFVRQNDDGQHVLSAQTPEFALSLTLSPSKPPVIHGTGGVSQKADCIGCASHYYSYTRSASQGRLRLGQQTFTVLGESWMDHEFGSNQLQPEQTGWDWFSLQLADNTELMLYVLRRKDGTVDPNSSGTWVDSSGRSTHLTLDDFTIDVLDYWVSADSNGRYPSRWKLSLPKKVTGQPVELFVTPVVSNQELTDPRGSGLSYWEGRCRVTGKSGELPLSGNAYVEMTGYSSAFKQKI